MSITIKEFYGYQLLHYFVTKHQYQIIRVNDDQSDLWLANAHATYPIIRISCDDEVTEEKLKLIKNVVQMISELIQCKKKLLIVDIADHAMEYPLSNVKYCHVTPSEISNHDVSKEFGNLSLLLKDHEDRMHVISEMSKEIDEAQKINQLQFIQEAKKRLRPKFSYLIIAISAVFLLFTIFLHFKTVEIVPALVANGAYYKTNIIAAHEYWRFLTAAFVYPDLFTGFLMVFLFYQVAKQCEPLFKRNEIIILTIGSILAGYASIFISDGNVVAFGAGSLIWGFAGAYFVAMISSKTYRIPVISVEMFKIAIYALLSWSMPGMSIIGHLSGLLFGVLFACSTIPSNNLVIVQKHAKNALVLFICMLVVACFYARKQVSYDPSFDHEVSETYQKVHMDGYAKYLESCYEKAYEME